MRFTEAMKNEIIERAKAGETYAQIAADYDCHESTISHLARRNGIARRVVSNRGKVCPKCRRSGLANEYAFCPYCATDIRSETEIVAVLLERAIASMAAPFSERDSKINFAMQKALDFIKRQGR